MNLTVTRRGYIVVTDVATGTEVSRHSDWDEAIQSAANRAPGSESEITMVKRVKVRPPPAPAPEAPAPPAPVPPAPVPVPPPPAPVPEPPPPPPPAPVARTLPGLVLREKSYWHNIKPFVDLMKSAHGGWQGANGANVTTGIGADGWPKQLAPGTTYSKLISTSDDRQYSVNRLGTYIVRSSNPAIEVTFHASVVTANLKRIGPNRASIDVVWPIGGGNVLRVSVKNAGTTPLDISGVQVFHADDEALLDADPLAFQPSFLDSLRGARVLRMSVWMNAVSAGMSQLEADLPSVEIDYFGTDADCVMRCPPQLLTRLAQQTGASIWVNFPAKASDLCMLAYAEGMKPGWPDGQEVIAEAAGLEPWNRAWPYVFSGQWLENEYSKTIQTVTAAGVESTSANDRLACAVADQSFRLWRAFEAVFGPGVVRRVLCGQGAWPERFGAAFAYVDPVSGRRLGEVVEMYAISLYLRLQAGGVVNSVDLKTMKEANAQDFPAVWYQVAMLNNLPKMAEYLDANLAYLAKINPSIKLGTYEWGNEFFVPPLPYTLTLDAAAQLMVTSTTDVSAAFATGEQLSGEYGKRPALALSQYAVPSPFVRVVPSGLKLFPTRDDALADTNALALDGAPGTYRFDNQTRRDGIDKRIKEQLDSEFGAELYRRFFALLVDRGTVSAVHHCDTGNYWIGNSSGLKRSQYDPDTPRAAWFRTATAGVSAG